MRFTDEVYRQKINEVVTAMAENEGPYLLHCVEGKDRTGFLSALLEALCGADYAEIEADYMKTYDNYYGINQNDTPEQYQTIREQYLNIILEEIVSDDSVDVTEADLASYAYDYLVNIGIREDVIRKLQANLQNGS
jgi:protein tyrosine/serine phosphatase